MQLRTGLLAVVAIGYVIAALRTIREWFHFHQFHARRWRDLRPNDWITVLLVGGLWWLVRGIWRAMR